VLAGERSRHDAAEGNVWSQEDTGLADFPKQKKPWVILGITLDIVDLAYPSKHGRFGGMNKSQRRVAIVMSSSLLDVGRVRVLLIPNGVFLMLCGIFSRLETFSAVSSVC